MDLRIIDDVRTVHVEKVIQESNNIRSLLFKDDYTLASKSGQFAMVWIPSIGEVPMSLSLGYGKKISSIVVKVLGEGTRKLYESKLGDVIGIRGPYGNHFSITRGMRRVLLVGGGTGMAPIVAAAKELRIAGSETRMVIAARTRIELPFLRVCKKLSGTDNVYPTTDDGTMGMKGLAHEQVRELVEDSKFDCIFACGPESMMYETFKIANERSIPVQFSLERLMKCGIAICGSCCIGDIVLCRDGPVLNSRMLIDVSSEFGFFERDESGKLVKKGKVI